MQCYLLRNAEVRVLAPMLAGIATAFLFGCRSGPSPPPGPEQTRAPETRIESSVPQWVSEPKTSSVGRRGPLYAIHKTHGYGPNRTPLIARALAESEARRKLGKAPYFLRATWSTWVMPATT